MLTALADLIRSALLLHGGSVASSATLAQALLIVFLAGVSAALGQSFVLLATRVSRARFLRSVALQAGVFAFGYLLWSFVIWLASRYLFGEPHDYRFVLTVIGVAYSPFLLSFFVLVPYAGVFFSHLLSVWTLLAILLASRDQLDLTLLQAFLSAGAGWFLLHLLSTMIGRPLLQLTSVLRRHVRRVARPSEDS